MKRGIEFELGGGACGLLTAMLRLPALHNMTAICTEYEAVTNQGNLALPTWFPPRRWRIRSGTAKTQVIFLNLKLLPPGEQGGEISDYEDFLRSPYALVCLITDPEMRGGVRKGRSAAGGAYRAGPEAGGFEHWREGRGGRPKGVFGGVTMRKKQKSWKEQLGAYLVGGAMVLFSIFIILLFVSSWREYSFYQKCLKNWENENLSPIPEHVRRFIITMDPEKALVS